MLFKRFIVKQKTRVLLIKNGKLFRILEPGNHIVFLSPFANWRTETHAVRNAAFRSRSAYEMFDGKGDLMRKYFNVIETNDSQLAMISVNGTLNQVLLPSRRALFWKDGSSIDVEYIDFIDSHDTPDTMTGAVTLANAHIDAHLSVLDDSGTASLLERALGHEDCIHTHGNS
jgi:hypothetical protein